MDNIDRKQMIQNGFNTVATGYDHPSLPFFPETAKRLIQYLQLPPHYHLLDICCGTGCVAIRAAEALPQGKVTGIDFSTGMLQQARDKAKSAGLNNTEFKQMDMEALEFPAHSFDVAISSFGLFFVEDMTTALQGITRTVKPGGKVAITSFTGDAFQPMSDIFVKNLEATGRTMPPLSWKRLATRELIEQHFNAAGITDISIYHEPLGYQMTSAQQWWDVVWNAGWRSLLNQMSEQEQSEFKKTHLEEIEQVIGSDGIWFNTEVLIAVGNKSL